MSETLLSRAYAGGWPARVWGRLTTDVAVLHHVLPVLPAGATPVRLGYASDLHIGPTTSEVLLARAASLLADARVDVLLLGGDYVFLEAIPTTAAKLTAWVRTVDAPETLAVFGNHDLWTHHGLLEGALVDAGARLLTNDAFVRGPVAIFGLDDPWTGRPDVARAVAACGDPPTRVALVHAPDGLPLLHAAGVRPDALLCGHTHGGQLALPGGRPLYVPGAAGRRWPHGRHEVDGTTLLVSRGLGGIEIPTRAWAPPDVMVVDLVSP